MIIENYINRTLRPYTWEHWLTSLKIIIYFNFIPEDHCVSNSREFSNEEQEPTPPVFDQWIAGMIPK